jgi:hypothetical protein
MNSTTKTPALPCPPWCDSSHGGDLDGTSHQAHRDFSDGAGYVTLYMQDNGVSGPEVLAHYNGRINLHVTWRGDPERSVMRPLAEAEKFAETAEAFGRGDIAALIRELAALATASPAAPRCGSPATCAEFGHEHPHIDDAVSTPLDIVAGDDE